MRELVCAICGGAERQLVYEDTIGAQTVGAGQLDPYGVHYRINRCLRCGLVYSSPILDPHEVSALYTQCAHTNVVAEEEGNVRRSMQRYYGLARPFLSGRDRMLDVGCDIGLMLDVARQDGFREVYGVEPVSAAATVARAIPGAVISSAFYQEQAFSDAHFDLVTLIHVMDHLVSPTELLRRAWGQLKPGGVILTVVHNHGSLLSRVLGERFPPYNLYHHYFFSKRTLRRLFEQCAFEVLRVVSTYNCYSMGFLVQKVPVIPASVKQAAFWMLDALRIARLSLTVPLGNIGIVARRPLTSGSPLAPKKEAQ